MAQATDTIALELTLDTGRFDRDVARAREAAEQAATASGKASSATEQWEKRAKALKARLSQQAGVIAQITLVLGQQNSAMSAVINTAGAFAAAFGAGGPIGVALAATGTALNFVAEKWNAVRRAKEEAEKASIAGVQGIVGSAMAERDRVLSSLREQRGESSLQQQVADLRSALADAEANLAASAFEGRAEDVPLFGFGNPALATTARRERIQAQIDDLRITLAQLEPILEETRAAELELAQARLGVGQGTGARGATGNGATIVDRDAVRDALEDQALATLSADADVFRMREQEERKHVDIVEAMHDDARDARQKAEEDAHRASLQRAEELGAAAEQSVTRLSSAAARLAVASIAAQGSSIEAAKDAQRAAMTDVLKAGAETAGGLIMLEGGKVLAQGIGMAATGNPAAAAPIIAGLGLVAAGEAVRTGGAAAIDSLLPLAGATSSRAASGGAHRGGSGNVGSGESRGTVVVNVAYGVNGPLPEDTARAVAQAVAVGSARGIG